MRATFVALALAACGGLLADGAPRQVARVHACEAACAETLRSLAMSVVEGTVCRCWAPLAPGEAPRLTTARIVLP